MQHFILPAAYGLFCLKNPEVNSRLAVLADAHHDDLPFSMEVVDAELKRAGFIVCRRTKDYSKLSAGGLLKEMVGFMSLYSRARYVFICDNFLPAASCKKRRDTTLIQLWHAGGALKKFGYDSKGDIPPYYVGNVFRNYDLVTVSAQACVKPFASAMRTAPERVLPLGISRTDLYFDEKWRKQCRDKFKRAYPNAGGKKVLLWAPTFRGNPAAPYVIGGEEIEKLEKMIREEWLVIKRLHPHMRERTDSAENQMKTEELLPVADFLVTDYSSIVFDWLLFERPFAFLAPDISLYEKERGFYTALEEFPAEVAKNAGELYRAVTHVWTEEEKRMLNQCLVKFMGACDGRATERIIKKVGIDG